MRNINNYFLVMPVKAVTIDFPSDLDMKSNKGDCLRLCVFLSWTEGRGQIGSRWDGRSRGVRNRIGVKLGYIEPKGDTFLWRFKISFQYIYPSGPKFVQIRPKWDKSGTNRAKMYWKLILKDLQDLSNLNWFGANPNIDGTTQRW